MLEQYKQGNQFFTQPAAAQPQTGAARALAFARSLTGSAVALAGLVFVLQATMKDGSKPSDLIGGFHGGTNSAQLNTERQAQVDTARQLADAQVAAQARWNAISASLEMKQNAASIADGICLSAPLVGGLFGRDAAAAVQAMKEACAEGPRLRREIIEEQTELSRLGLILSQRPVPSGASPVPPR